MTETPLEAESNFDAGGQAALEPDKIDDPIAQGESEPSDTGQPAPDDAGITGEEAGPAPAETSPEETFFDPKDLEKNPELKVPYGNMQRAFTKKMMALSEAQKSVDAYKAFEAQFQADPKGTIEKLAKSQGLHLVSPETQPSGPKPFGEGWEPANWNEVADGFKGMVKDMIGQAVGPINKGLGAIETQTFESTLDGIMPEWREYEQDVADTLTMAPGLMKDPEKLLRASLPQKVIEGRAYQAALKRMRDQQKSSTVGGSSTTTARPETEPDRPLTFEESVEAAKKELGLD
jgi:hypothetical protein